MKAYELLYFVSPSIDESARETVNSRITGTVEEGKGKIDSIDNWGKRKLAYEIGEMSDADYTLVNFHAEENTIAELDRVMRINDAVVRHMITSRPE